MTDVVDKTRQFIVDNFLFGQAESFPGDDESLMETGVIDSTGVLELVSFLEESFQIKVKDTELVPDNLDSLNRLVDFVRRKQASLDAQDP